MRTRFPLQTCDSRLHAEQRACLAALESLYDKYALTSDDIKKRCDATTPKLKWSL